MPGRCAQRRRTGPVFAMTVSLLELVPRWHLQISAGRQGIRGAAALVPQRPGDCFMRKTIAGDAAAADVTPPHRSRH